MRRRSFLAVSGAAAAELVLAFSWGCGKSGAKDKEGKGERTAGDGKRKLPPGSQLNAYIAIGSDDSVQLLVPEAEMGQGVFTALALVLADELGAAWANVTVGQAPVDRAKYGEQFTGSSTSVRSNLEPMRKAAASAREMLVGAAAARWKAPPAECDTADNQVIHAGSGRKLRFGELAAEAAALTPPASPTLRDPAKSKLVGKPTRLLEARSKARGEATYGIDVRRPGQLYAVVSRAPTFGAVAQTIDEKAAMAVPGVKKTVDITNGVAVVAENTWAAIKGREALKTEWTAGDTTLSNQTLTEALERVVSKGKVAATRGAVGKFLRGGSVVAADYRVPFLAHAAMEPLNTTAHVKGGKCEIWSPTQVPTLAKEVAIQVLGVKPEDVTVHQTFIGGGFGRRLLFDYVQDAVEVAKAIDAPVQVVWTREDEFTSGYFRPAALSRMEGRIDKGKLVAWRQQIAAPSISRVIGEATSPIDRFAVEGAAQLPYSIPNFEVTYSEVRIPVPSWHWRSVGYSLNGYFVECFLDELAASAELDPLELRLALLADKPRHAAVLRRAAERIGWGKPPEGGRALGIALVESYGSIVAEAAEVSQADGHPRVHRVACAIDCGRAINPLTIEAQAHGGVAFGLSAVLYGVVDLEKGAVLQKNFDRYRVVRMGEMPSVEVDIIESGEAVGGVGETFVPPVAPAVCNALRKLTGQAVRTLPLIRAS